MYTYLSVLLSAKIKTTCECELPKKALSPLFLLFLPRRCRCLRARLAVAAVVVEAALTVPRKTRTTHSCSGLGGTRGMKKKKGAPFCCLGDLLLGDEQLPSLSLCIYIFSRCSTIIRIPFLNNQLLRL